MTDIKYPFLPEDRTILYVPANNQYMMEAKEFARQNNTVKHIGAAVLVKEGQIIGRGSIGAGLHGKQGNCTREKMNVPTGTQYELCQGCGPEYHSEAGAIHDAKMGGEYTRDADLYLWGHWWCCEPCWKAIVNAGIKDVYLLEGSEHLFNKADPANIIGRQFE